MTSSCLLDILGRKCNKSYLLWEGFKKKLDNATHFYEVMFMVQKLSIQNENITKFFGCMFQNWLTLHSMQQVLSAAW